MPSLRIEVGGQVVHARLSDAPVRVGRDVGCDLRIDAADVAAAQVVIEALPGGGHKLTDLNSGRPTLVNGLVVKRVALKSGDRIEVGPARITYLADGATLPAAAPAVTPAATPAVARASVPARAPTPPAARAVAAVAVASPAAAVPPSTVPAAAPAVATPTAADPAARATPTAAAVVHPRPAHAASRKKLTGALVATLVFAACALGVAALIRSRGDDVGVSLPALKAELDAAVARSREDVDAGLADLDRLAQSPVDGIRRAAKNEADYLRRQLARASSDVADLEQRAGRLSADRIASELALLRERHGAGVLARHAAAIARMESTRQGAIEQRARDATSEAAAFADAGRFGDALARWDVFVAVSPGDEVARQLAEDGRAAVEAKATDAFKALAVEADALATKTGPRAAAMLLRERLAGFAGTSAATAVALRAAGYDHEAVAAIPAASASTDPRPASAQGSTPRPSPSGATAAGPTPAPSTPRAPATPSLSAVDRARVAALLTDADAHAAGRRYREALAALAQAASVAEGTADAARIAARREDLELAKTGLTTICAAVKAHPERFTAIEIAPHYPAALVDADEEFLVAAVRGGTTKVRWASFDPARLAALVESAALPGKDALPTAALLREAGAKDASEKLLYRAIEGGVEKAAIDARLARWRGEPVPAGGYVPYEGRLVAPAERDRLVLEAKIASACARVGARDAKERRAAYDELLGVGAPAKEAFAKALRARREAAAKEVAASKAFSSGRTKQHLLDELQKRRAAALALIEDEKAYPYPYGPDHNEAVQKEVDALVDRVREVWERPFDLVAAWDKSVEEALATVREVDEVLARVEEGYTGDMDAVRAAVNKAIDVPGVVAEAYDRDVLAFNEKVATSATPQEKENVRIVNRYRIMMGRQAVKIEERLVRAARGHSIEMRVKDYFAHESPTPGLESPGKRCAREGYAAGTGENIAWSSGVMNAQGAFDGWFHSSGHHRNMLGKGWTELGVGRSMREGNATYWTQNFGAMGGKSLKTPDALPPPRADVVPEKDPEDAAAAAAGDGGTPGSEPKDGAGPEPKDG